ncbi:nitrate- and nitrite sensing domain-containing protein [Actinomadura sp. SCN-SB]|uniref:sensor histidine kinase n=1 Tax=Actinomadura sp. SCN-SB TaxID=3373092 RepID=UPI0037500423
MARRNHEAASRKATAKRRTTATYQTYTAHERKPPRRRSIRLRIAALLLVPLLSLVGLWGFAASITLGPALDKYDYSAAYERIGLPGLLFVNQLQQERQLSVVALSARKLSGGEGGAEEAQRLAAQRKRVDALQATFLKGAEAPETKEFIDAQSEQRLAVALKGLQQLPALRSAVDSGRIETLRVIDGYSLMLDNIIQTFSRMVIVNDLKIFEQGRALISLGNSRAFMLREDALVTAALANNGRMTPAEHLAFVQSVAMGRREFDAGMNDLDTELRAPLERLRASEGYKSFRAMEVAIARSPDGRLPADAASWSATTPRLSQAWEQAVTQTSLAVNDLAGPIGERIVMRMAVAGGFGLLAVIASIVLSIMAARSLSRELRWLQRAALNLAEDRLPGVVARLRRGEEVDVQAEAPPLVVGKTTEVSRVGDAFTRVQRTAIETAVSEAHLRKGISRVFLNVAWRAQSLLHRQLGMLDEMERGTSDPKALEDLFRLDHLTTRMRRHAEGLVILSGASPGRGWSRPVHVDDVLRAAVSEVEDYTRVEVVVVSANAAVIGEVVADVIHLLAELIENATVFSPPPTEVLVRGEMGANGFAVDIVDRGIGLDQAELDALNQRLARPPEFDLADSDRLGLFVVSRLAHRHGIKVALQPSLYGGVSAVVLVPRELIVDVGTPEDEPDAERATISRPQVTGRPVVLNGGGGGDDGAAVPPGGNGNGWAQPTQAIDVEVWRNPAPAENGNGNNAELSAPVPEQTAPPMQDTSWARPGPRPGDRIPRVPQPTTPPESFGTGSGKSPLPRRVRQENLAPQLRDVGPPPYDATPTQGTPVWAEEDRAAEASRDLFASLQAGWLRGREEDEGPGGHAYNGEGSPS